MCPKQERNGLTLAMPGHAYFHCSTSFVMIYPALALPVAVGHFHPDATNGAPISV